ncbi:hypothetical protein TUMEXPCC7403_17420 [Tumidithrix helvetica PCC 7403]|uniref:hypothetical protein n=1 Tax=Tumidithrix helvetica TaxID=3457545 RepID=UPI003CC28528
MMARRICVTFSAIATLAIALPAIAETIPATPRTVQTSVKPIGITDLAGVYKGALDPKVLRSRSVSEQRYLEQSKPMLDSLRLTVKPDSSFEMISPKNGSSSKTITIVGKVKIDKDKVTLSVVKVDGNAVGADDKSYPPAVFQILEGGKVWQPTVNPVVNLIRL